MGLLTLAELDPWDEHRKVLQQDVVENRADVLRLVASPETTLPPARYMVSPGSTCPSGWERMVGSDRVHAIAMIRSAVPLLRSYGGEPGLVRQAMEENFSSSSTQLARVLAGHLEHLVAWAPAANYACGDSSGPGKIWRCSESVVGWAAWCVPFFWIRLCSPTYFSLGSRTRRAVTLIHEWAHKYLCRLDLGYSSNPQWKSYSPVRQFLNADAWAWLVERLWAGGD